MAGSRLIFTYFDLRGVGEVTRIILAYAKKEYDNVMIPWGKEEWFKMKPTIPLQQLPLLDMDGEVVPQSVAISNYLAKEFGLYPATSKEQLSLDVIWGIHGDMMNKAATWFYLDDGEEKSNTKAQVQKDTVKYVDYLESLLRKSGTGYVAGSSLTVADIAVFDIITGYLRHSLEYTPEKYPLIAQNMENVLKVETIKKYVDSRPDFVW